MGPLQCKFSKDYICLSFVKIPVCGQRSTDLTIANQHDQYPNYYQVYHSNIVTAFIPFLKSYNVSRIAIIRDNSQGIIICFYQL
jgi:hypothetical protein